LSYAEREHLRPKVKNIRLSQYVKDRFSEWRVELARTLPSVEIFEAKASEIDLAGVQTDLPLGIPKGDAWLVQESGCGEYQDF
jgi:hypothetical protein